MGNSDNNGVIDARAELIARAKDGSPPLDPFTHPAVRDAIAHTLLLVQLADLRPCARWLMTALEHGKRAGAPIPPPAPRPEESLFINAPQPRNTDLHVLAKTAHAAAIQHGVGSLEFKSMAEAFVAAWKHVAIDAQLITPPPPHPELDFFRNGLALALAHTLHDASDASIGPMTFALILAAIGTDEPIVLAHDDDTVADAINVRAEHYKKLWQPHAGWAKTAEERFIVLPGRPIPLRSGKASLLEPPFFTNQFGNTVAYRPAGIPVHAAVRVVARGKRRWFYAQWREAGRVKKVALGPAA